MTDEDKKLVFEYMGWEDKQVINTTNAINEPMTITTFAPVKLDGNDMVAAMNKMTEMGDWESFEIPCFKKKADAQEHLNIFLGSCNPPASLNSWQRG